MTIQVINTGTSANAGNGDSIRTAFTKVNQNFEELSTLVGTTGTTLTELVQDETATLFVHADHIGITAAYDDTENQLELTLSPATDTLLGGVRTGEGVSVDGSGLLEVVPATTSTLGGIKTGEGVSVDGSGLLEVVPATTSTLGGIKTGNVGTGLSITEEGLLTSNLQLSSFTADASFPNIARNLAVFMSNIDPLNTTIHYLEGATFFTEPKRLELDGVLFYHHTPVYANPSNIPPVQFSQSHETADAANFNFLRTRGTKDVPTDVRAGDDVADIVFSARHNDINQGVAAITVNVLSTSTASPVGKFQFGLSNGTVFAIGSELTSSSTWRINRLEPYSSADLTIDSNVVPFKDAISNLGKIGATWKNLYLENGIIAVNTAGNLSVNGTEISFTTSTLVNGAYTVALSNTGTLETNDISIAGNLTVTGEIVASKLTIEYTTVTTTLVTTDDIIQTTNTTNSTSTETGALIVGGGVGIAGDVFIGGSIDVAGASIADTTIANWNTAYGWGDHSTASYLTSYTETDPIFSTSTAASITATNVTNWDTAYGWGDHSTAGYLQSGVESTATSFIGILKVIQTDEKFVSTTTNASLVEYDCSTAHIFNVTSMTGDFTANLTNLSVDAEYATNVTLILNQGPIAYISTGLQIDGVSQSIYWQGGSVPSGTFNKKDIVNFSILTTGTFQYLVLGQLSSFG